MKPAAKIAFLIFIFALFSLQSTAQRAAGENTLIAKGKNAAQAAAPIAEKIYKRVEDRSGVVQSVGKAVEEAKPLIEKAIPIVQKGFRTGKKILKILKKILR